MKRSPRALAVITSLGSAVLVLSGCGGSTASTSTSTSLSSASPGSATPDASPSASGSAPASASAAVPLTINVAGDTQAYGPAEAIDTQGLGATGRVLGDADLSMVNLETVVADSSAGLVAQPKQFTFVTDPRILTVLKDTGVDVVTSANNHGMDYGQEGLRRMLLVKDRHILPMLGIGHDADEAYQPFTTQVRGRRVVVFGASDVLDPTLNWTATATRPGMAYLDTPGALERLEAAVRQQRAADPNAAILVFLHWGHERVRCPTDRQQLIARGLSDAGATAVVGSHAHIQQPTATVGHTAVAYGLGNFVFGSGQGDQRRTGVLTISVPASTSTTPTLRWTPAEISGGLPHLLQGQAKQQAIDEFDNLGQGCSR